MLKLTFGTPEEVARTAARINAIHNRVHGTIREPAGAHAGGTSYSARDPALLLWVHATLMYSLPKTYELLVGPLTPDERDAFCRDSALRAPLFGVPDGYYPTTTAGIQRYIDHMLDTGQLAISEVARDLAREVLNPPHPPLSGPLLSMLRLPAIGLLPPRIRDAYGFRWELRHELAMKSSVAAMRGLVRLSPPIVRYWPVSWAAAAQAS
jgi:uncharacterized protein (DUF2236 family)